MASLKVNCCKVKVDLPIYRRTKNLIIKYFSELKNRRKLSYRKCNICSRKVQPKYGHNEFKIHLREHEHAFENYLESVAQAMQQEEDVPELLDSSDEDDDSDDSGDSDDEDDIKEVFYPYNAVDCLQASTYTRDKPNLTTYERNLKHQYNYDDQTDPEYQEFSDFDVFQLCNWWRIHDISEHLGKALPDTRMNPGSLYDTTNSKVIHMIDRLICPRNCYFEPEKCFFDDQHSHDYKELLHKDVHEKYNPGFAELFHKEGDENVKLTRFENNHPNTSKLARDIGFTTKLEYDRNGYLLLNFDAIQKKFWDYETPQFVLEQKKVLDILLALLESSKIKRQIEEENITRKYEQRENCINPPILAIMHHGPDLEINRNVERIQCNLENDERKYGTKEYLLHENCVYLKRSDHWTYKHHNDHIYPSGSQNEYPACETNDGKVLDGPVSMPDQSISYPCNLKHCWKFCICRFCKLARNYECQNHKVHMQHDLKSCVLQQAAQCQDHWVDHPDNFSTGDIAVMKNILFHNGQLLRNGRQYCTKKVKFAGLKLICVQCREDVREHFSKHWTFHSQCKLCLHELKSVEDKTFWETVCQVCGKKYISKKVRDHHMKKHEEDKLVCDHCEDIFSSKFTLHRHIQEQHNIILEANKDGQVKDEEDNVKCKICDQEFKYRRNLAAHLANVHNKADVCECKICGMKITKSSNLKRHLLEQHSILDTKRELHREETPEYKCEQCEKKFKRKDHLVQHLQTHQDLKTCFKCEECFLSFSNIRNLERHKKLHLESTSKYTCDLCGEQFTQKFNLERHLKLHTEPDKKYSCNICGKNFSREDNLNNHQKSCLK